MRYIIFSILFCINLSATFAQSKLMSKRFSKIVLFNEGISNGDFYYSEGDYETALPFYKELNERFPNDVFFLYRLGVCYTHSIKETNRAIEYLEKVYKIDPSISDIYFRMAQAYFFNARYSDAYNYSLLYNKYGKSRKFVVDNNQIMLSSKNVLNLSVFPSEYLVYNADSDINTVYAEYATCFDDSNIYYTYRGDEEAFNYKKYFNFFYNKKKQLIASRDYNERIVAHVKQTSIALSQPKDEYFNKQWEMVFTKLNDFIDYKGRIHKLRYKQKIKQDFIQKHQLPKFKPSYKHYATVACYKNKLYVYKDMKRKGSGEIYELVNKKLVPLKGINSNAWEGSATFFNNGNNIVFSSNRKNGKGGKDLYLATLNGDSYSAITLLDSLNTYADEDAPFFDEQTQTLYFSSNNSYSGIGGFDVYKSQWDGQSFSPAKNLGFPVNSINDDIYFTKKDDKFYLSSNRRGGFGAYDIYIAHYLDSKNFKIGSIPSQIVGITNATKVKLYVKNPADSAYYFYGFYSSNRFNDSIVIPIQSSCAYKIMPIITESNEFMKADTNKAINLKFDEYNSFDYPVNLIFRDNKLQKKNAIAAVKVTNKIEQTIVKKNRVELMPITFDVNAFELKKEHEDYLELLAQDFNDKKIPQIEITGYTDPSGKEEYNILLSKQRAKSVYDFFMLKKLKVSYITYNGGGINKDCTGNNQNCRIVIIIPVWD